MILSRLEWLLLGIIIVQLFLNDSLWGLLKKIGGLFKMVFTWLGVWPALSALLAWIGGKWIPRWVSALLSVLVTFLGALSGYYKGYNKGYDDALAGRSRSWTASIHRMFVKEEVQQDEQKGWFSWFRKKS